MVVMYLKSKVTSNEILRDLNELLQQNVSTQGYF